MSEELQELAGICISQSPELNSLDTDELLSLAENFIGHIPELVAIYQAIAEDRLPEINPLSFQQADDGYHFKDPVINFSKEQLVSYLAILIDVYDEIVPLGSVVDLKKEYLKDSLPVDKIENVRIVITHRFLHNPQEKFYFPYAGVVYPLGSFGNERVLHFTSPFIERVVHRGFSDEQDEAFVLAMKRELLGDRHIHSYAFASRDEVTGAKGAT